MDKINILLENNMRYTTKFKYQITYKLPNLLKEQLFFQKLFKVF